MWRTEYRSFVYINEALMNDNDYLCAKFCRKDDALVKSDRRGKERILILILIFTFIESFNFPAITFRYRAETNLIKVTIRKKKIRITEKY